MPAGQPAGNETVPEIPIESIARRESDIANWFFRPQWTSTPAPKPSIDPTGDLLVFENESGLGREVVKELCAGLPVVSKDDPHSLVLEFPHPGDTLGSKLVARERRPPGPGEVEILVHSAGLNFADALKVSGVLPDAPFGMEAAGVVIARGPGVTAFVEGDEVVAIGPDSFRTHLTRDARLVTKKPSALSWEAAATLPAAFMTAVHALESVARLAPGERVLIHAATGGVGMAALQVAKAHDAEIFATAGTAAKRDQLKALGLTNVFDSRSPLFAEEIRVRTGGRGVDVVLNSLTGDLLAKSLQLVAPGGRFVELGKREILTADQLTRLELATAVEYHPIDLTTIMRDDPAGVRTAAR